MNLDLQSQRIQKLFSQFQKCCKKNIDKYLTGEARLVLPQVPLDLLSAIFQKATSLFTGEPTVLNLTTPIVIIGDLHGQLLDLFRILKVHSDWSTTRFLFLGDLVDRGCFSTETVVFVFLLKILYPDTVHIIRGNHEFAEIYTECGFATELGKIYKDSQSLLNLFEIACSYIPLAAMIDGEMLCVHGGIGPSVNSVADIRNERRPQTVFTPGPMDDVLWSDPDDTISMFVASKRGSGHCFGPEALSIFLDRNRLKCLIRGHQCVDTGVQEDFDGELITVFSASNYCGVTGNRGGVLVINKDGTTSGEMYPPMPHFPRERALFRNYESDEIENKRSVEIRSSLATPKKMVQSSRLPAISKSRPLTTQKNVTPKFGDAKTMPRRSSNAELRTRSRRSSVSLALAASSVHHRSLNY